MRRRHSRQIDDSARFRLTASTDGGHERQLTRVTPVVVRRHHVFIAGELPSLLQPIPDGGFELADVRADPECAPGQAERAAIAPTAEASAGQAREGRNEVRGRSPRRTARRETLRWDQKSRLRFIG